MFRLLFRLFPVSLVMLLALPLYGNGPGRAPADLTVSGQSIVNYPENAASRVSEYFVSPDGPGLTWSVSGVDGDSFTIDRGILRFTSPPDHESPSDSDQNGQYNVTVGVSTGAEGVSTQLTVVVTDIDEAGSIALTPLRPRVGQTMSASLADPDGVAGEVIWTWERSVGRSGWAVIESASSDSYTPLAADAGRYIRVTASYADGHGPRRTANAVAPYPPRAHELSGLAVTGSTQEIYPAFEPEILHYAIGCSAESAIQIRLSAVESGTRVAVNGIQTVGTDAYVVLEEPDPGGDIEITLARADGASTTYVLHCLPADYPVVTVTRRPGAWHGLILGAVAMGSGGGPNRWSFLSVIDTNGVPRFHRRIDEWRVSHFKHQPEGAFPYGYMVAVSSSLIGAKHLQLLDENLENALKLVPPGSADAFEGESMLLVAPRSADEDERLDIHDFLSRPNGNTVIVNSDPTVRDLRAFFDEDGEPYDEYEEIEEASIREVTLDGETVFEWNTRDHIEIADCTQHNFVGDDYSHFNSIEIFEGNYLVSFKGCSKVLLIDGTTGEVLWRLGRTNLSDQEWIAGGRQPPLKIVGDPYGEFCGQHSAKISGHRRLLLYDNGNECLRDPVTGATRRQGDQFSRVVEYYLDPGEGEASFLRHHSLHSDFSTFTDTTGLVAPMDNGNWLISWGRANPDTDNPPGESITEVDPETNEELLHVRFSDSWDIRRTSRAYPLRHDEFRSAPIPLAAQLGRYLNASDDGFLLSDGRQVEVTFSRPVADFPHDTPSLTARGGEVIGVRPHLAPGARANTYIVSVVPTGSGPITLMLAAGQQCSLGGICTADGATLTGDNELAFRFPAAGELTITGTPEAGRTLTVDVSEIEDMDGLAYAEFRYQWYWRNGTHETPVPGATDSFYRLTSKDIGNSIRVRVSFTDDYGYRETLASAPTRPVTGVVRDAYGPLLIFPHHAEAGRERALNADSS